MPFTVSHVAAVLPFLGRTPSRLLVPAALVIGSMVPDLPHFVPPHRGLGLTHSAFGPLTVDLAMGLVLVAVWHLLLHRPLVDLAPRWIARRVPMPTPWPPVRWAWAAVSVVLGAYTHVILDAFTHPQRWGTRVLPVLNADLGPFLVYSWLQFGLSVVGLLLLGIWVADRLGRAAPQPEPPTHLTSGQRRLASATIVTVFAGSVIVAAVRGIRDGQSLELTAYQIATISLSLTAAVAMGLCLVWQIDARLRSPVDALR